MSISPQQQPQPRRMMQQPGFMGNRPQQPVSTAAQQYAALMDSPEQRRPSPRDRSMQQSPQPAQSEDPEMVADIAIPTAASGHPTALEHGLENALMNKAHTKPDIALRADGQIQRLATPQESPTGGMPMVQTPTGLFPAETQLLLEGTVRRTPTEEIVTRHVIAVEGGIVDERETVHLSPGKGIRRPKTPESMELIVCSSEVKMAAGYRETTTRVVYETTDEPSVSPTSKLPAEVTPNIVSQLVLEEIADVDRATKLHAPDLKHSSPLTYGIKKRVNALQLNKMDVQELEDTVTWPPPRADQAQDDPLPELLASMMMTEEKGLAMGSTPDQLYSALFGAQEPVKAEDGTVEVNSVATHPLNDVVVPASAASRDLHFAALTPELATAAVFVHTAIISTDDSDLMRPSDGAYAERVLGDNKEAMEHVKVKNVGHRDGPPVKYPVFFDAEKAAPWEVDKFDAVIKQVGAIPTSVLESSVVGPSSAEASEELRDFTADGIEYLLNMDEEHAGQDVKERIGKACSSRNNDTKYHLFNENGKDAERKIQNQPDDLFMELIKDIANELDIDVLCLKILKNVSLLTKADRGSLFLTKVADDEKCLVAKLFDIQTDTSIEEAKQLAALCKEIRIPFGVGIAGQVAETKTIINIKDAYSDPRFNSEVDRRTGYKTKLILCLPICNYEGDIIGVAQIINKIDDCAEFSDKDIELFQRYLTFCGIGIQNAQLFEKSVIEYHRNQILLNLARSIFEEQNNLECLVTKIMREAQVLLDCERCSVYLLDLDCCEANHLENIVERPGKTIERHKPLTRMQSDSLTAQDLRKSELTKPCSFSMVFELRNGGSQTMVSKLSSFDLKFSTLMRIASYSATTARILNIGDVHSWLVTERHSVGDAGFAKTILCMPILNGQRTLIGVAQLINKNNGNNFTDCDVSLFEAFAIFCGLGIHNTQMYENACKLMAKQKVALECLSYHATADNEATEQLVRVDVPNADYFNLHSFTFNDFDFTDVETCQATIRMFTECNLIHQFHIPYEVLCRWILSVKKNYRKVKYHNWRHALNVAQTMFAMFKTGKMERFMEDLDILGLLVACLCHDLDHRGTNNAFQTKTESPLAILYTTSTMEHHHFDQCVMILNSDSNNIFQSLSPDDYRRVMKLVETAILSTDLAMYFKKRKKFLDLIDNGEFDFQGDDKKDLLSGMMMTACDVSAIAKPWEVQHKIAKLVADEFFDQGDMEKLQLKEQPVAMMDRERKDELPQMQVGFIDVICIPLYRVLSETFPWMQPLYQGTLENRKHWQDLAEKVEMGLTWIDHDTIEAPVETFIEEDAKSIEFTVQTLQSTATTGSNCEPCGLNKMKRKHKLCSLL